jgi:RND family efflux transporter MFP subunit
MWRKKVLHNRKVFWIVLIVVLAAAGGGYYYYDSAYAQPEEAVGETVQSARVRQGELVISASGSGTLVPADDVSLGFTSGGVLAEVLVEVGDHVDVGDILARLDDLSARQALISAQLQVAQAEDSLNRELDAEAAQREVELAEAQLEQAQLALDELLDWSPDEGAVERAQANLEAAQASYEATTNKSAYDQTASVRISLEQAQTSLADAQAAYDTAWDPARDWELYDPRQSSRLESERESATSNLERAYQSLELAQANYNLAWAGMDDSSELSAWSQVLSAQAALEEAQTGPDEADILAAQIQVLQAQTDLAQVLADQASDPGQAQLTLEQARLNLESAQETLEQLDLVAPIGGIVTAVDAQSGQSVGTSSIIALSNLDELMVELYLDETDLDKIAVGNEVEVIFDALPDETFAGYVVRVEPELVTMEGVPTVQAVAVLEGVGLEELPAGLNASVDVIGGRAENALLVSVEALRELSPGEYAVFVVGADGSLEMRPVQVGLMDYSNAEIISGLELGEEVSTGIVETN